MYKVMWWNAAGDAQVSESMDKATAIVFRDSMLPEQEARIFHVKF